ncbi:MAG: DUF433 domain-containing protein [Candidatus Binataceae bacterium]
MTKSKGKRPSPRTSAHRKRTGQAGANQNAMKQGDLLARISIDPNVCFGKPCIRGHRIWVSLILDFLASGEKVEQILSRYPQLIEEDIRACVAYGAELAKGRFIDIPTEERA